MIKAKAKAKQEQGSQEKSSKGTSGILNKLKLTRLTPSASTAVESKNDASAVGAADSDLLPPPLTMSPSRSSSRSWGPTVDSPIVSSEPKRFSWSQPAAGAAGNEDQQTSLDSAKNSVGFNNG